MNQLSPSLPGCERDYHRPNETDEDAADADDKKGNETRDDVDGQDVFLPDFRKSLKEVI